MIPALRRWLGSEGAAAAPARAAVSREEAGRLMRQATWASVAVASILITVKTATWLLTGSISILSSLVDSVMDVMASLVNLFAVHHALQPPDAEHRFGHGKAESLAGLGQAAFIAVSAIFIMFEAARRMVTPRPVDHADVGIAVMVFSIVLTIALVVFQRYVVRRTDSIAVGADALHYETDVLINASVIVSLVLSTWLGWHRADPLFGLAIAVYLLRGAWRIARRALDVLMDHEFANEDRDRIRDIVLAHPRVKGMHDLRTRSSGVQPFIQLHLELDGDMPLRAAHEIADEVEARIKERYPGAEILIHQDPEGLIEEQPRFAQS
ncbi:MAG: cation diffusion facilitator family transporter [Proteobacteria bacterium]|nr:cation diffusion facilitator family transporter [Pseudomonadota bacterium]